MGQGRRAELVGRGFVIYCLGPRNLSSTLHLDMLRFSVKVFLFEPDYHLSKVLLCDTTLV